MKKKYKNRWIVRIGYFIGIYKKVDDETLILTKKVNNEAYSFKAKVKKELMGYNKPEFRWNANEVIRIPIEFDLRKRKHIDILASCLGVEEGYVYERICKQVKKLR